MPGKRIDFSPNNQYYYIVKGVLTGIPEMASFRRQIKMTVMERLANSIVVPVVVLDKVEDAVPTAKAMAAGGVDTMEITFRTACAPECIKAVAENCPDVLVGAGTIINVEQAKLAVEMGAKFIVSPRLLRRSCRLVCCQQHPCRSRLRHSHRDHGRFEARPEDG